MLIDDRILRACDLCPRRCGAARSRGARGICGIEGELKIARAALHRWEEPPISGTGGSGAIFFTGCPLHCVFCQNCAISTGNRGILITGDRLVEIMLELQQQGAANINLVTATQHAHALPRAIACARSRGLAIPIVYNTSGYERVQVVRALADVVDVWLPDFKYADADTACALSGAEDYPSVALRALREMKRQIDLRGGDRTDDAGMLRRGMIVRHLVLPGHVDESCRVLDLIWRSVGDVAISVMNQYTPNARMRRAGGELAGPLSETEYERVLDHADDLGFTTMYWQQGGTAKESFIPDFDATGVLGAQDRSGAGHVR